MDGLFGDRDLHAPERRLPREVRDAADVHGAVSMLGEAGEKVRRVEDEQIALSL